MSRLFRNEAVEYSTRRLTGEVILASSVRSRVLAVLFVGVVFGALAFAASSSYARRETVPGWLVPEAGMIRLTAREGGVLTRLHVGEGDRVEAGQAIATVTLSSAVAAGDSYAALRETLAAERSAAATRSQARLASLEAEEAQLRRRLALLRRELGEVDRRSALQTQRVELARAEVARAESIAAQGFLPRRELEARRSAALTVEQEASQLVSQSLAHQREIEEISARLAAIPIDVLTARAEAVAADAGLDRTATETEASSVQVITATVPGRVAALSARLGQALSPGASVAVLTGADSRLVAELYAPSRASGFLREGQEVRIQYEAYPHQKFGAGEGVLASVSHTTLTPAEVPFPGLQSNEPVLRLEVDLADEAVSAYGRELPLRPGMLLTADVIVDRRTLLEWLLDPLYAAGRR